MDHFVTLERLPDGLVFPPDLAGRITYDGDRKRLGFRGFMCKAEYDRLFALSEDWSYRRQLEELFRLCVDAGSPPRLKMNATIGLVAAFVVLAALLVLGWTLRVGRPAGPPGNGVPAPDPLR